MNSVYIKLYSVCINNAILLVTYNVYILFYQQKDKMKLIIYNMVRLNT